MELWLHRDEWQVSALKKVRSLVRDECVQIDIYNTRDNCWRIGLLKGL